MMTHRQTTWLCATASVVLLTVAMIVLQSFRISTVRAQVVINEFAYDDSGDDDEEFIELFNIGDDAVDLSGWTVETGDDLGPGPVYVLPGGTIIAGGAHLVVGSPLVPGVDVDLGGDLFGNGPAYIVLRREDDDVVDGVAYEANKGVGGFPVEATEEGAIWGNHVLVTGTMMSWQRWFDGYDTQHNGMDFGQLPWTPGEANDRAREPRFTSDFEDGEVEQAIDELPGSFVPGRRVDPRVESASNPSSVPESPDGGLVLVSWDPAGGGNFVVLDARPVQDLMFEAWVYFDARPELPDEIESWSLGLRGTSGTYYNMPVLYDANGNTGITWTYQVTAEGATLYLVDEGYGEPAGDRIQLGAISIEPAGNDRWQRLRLEVEGDRVTGYFGGTYGSTASGVRIEGQTREVGIGTFYMGYREALADTTQSRPLTLDTLVVGPLDSGETRFLRGNTNGDANANLSDAVFLLNYLYAGGPKPSCEKSGDSDDDGKLQLTDAIRLLNYLFLSGPAPGAPFQACGRDPTRDELTCEAFVPCE